MKTIPYSIIAISVSLALIAFLQPVHAQNISNDKNATLIVNFNSSKFSGYQGGSFTPSHDGSMYAFSTTIVDPKSHDWKSSLWLYFMKNGTTRSLDLNSDLSQISYVSFSADDKKLLFVGNGCDSDPSHTTFYVFNLLDIHLKCNDLTNVHDADWMPDGSIVFLQNNEENDTISIYQNGTQKLLYTKQITPPYISLNSSHIESIKASPDGKKIALWYFVMLSHKTQILNVDDGKITDTFDGGHPRWSQNSNMLLYTLPVGTGYYHDGPRSVITYINLLDVDNNKTTTIDSVPVGVDDLFLSANGSKAFYVAKVPSVYDFLNFTSGIYEIDLNHDNNHILGSESQFYNFSTTDGTPLHQFKSGIPADKVKCNDGFLLTLKSEDGSPACVTPETAKRLYEQGWASVLTVNIKNNNANQTLVIGANTYDVREFQPISGNAVYFDDMRFIYQGRSPLNDSCYPEIVNQTQARDFEIVSNDADFNSHSCWPPLNYPQNITKQNVLPSDLFSRYSISFFNNQTMGIGLCHADSCEFGKMIYLAKNGWDTPIVYDSVSNLEFHLFTNASTISTGQSIGINMSTINKAQNAILVPNKYNFSFSGTGLGPCYYGPFELEILRGYFDENNFTHGSELHMYQLGIYSCPAPEGAKGYKFEPSSDLSTPRCSPFHYCNNAEQMRDRVSFSGYWNNTDFHKFESGMYTIIAGDEWGNYSIKHFTAIR